MSKIKIMDEVLANKIAAGEVVEKCVSIVKELVENSIDAQAKEIIVHLKESGLREIKVIDDGLGMSIEDAKLAFQRHATSKLYDADDLFNITSLGFRGEALPSIAVVSEVELKTCQDNIGYLIHLKGGKILEETSCEARQGTSIKVTNLFYNTPARLKHLSNVHTELAHILEYLNKMALAYTNIKFILTNDDKELLNTSGSGNLLKVIKSIYGINVAKKMIYLDNENNDYHISGYISLPEVTRSNRNHMTVIVNGRIIKNSSLNKIINEAYTNFKEDSRYPIVVINITCDPILLDVNIHPSKMDIKFSNFLELNLLLKNTIIDMVKTKLLIPKMEVIPEKEEVKYENLHLDITRSTIKEEDKKYQTSLENLVNFRDEEDISLEDEEKEITTYMESNPQLPELYPVGLAFGTYIICQNERGLYLIDQHAAKERINYEIVREKLAHPSLDTIKMLVPLVMEFPQNEILIIKNNLNILEEMHIILEPFGQNSLRLIEHPVWFTKGMEDKIIKGIIELLITQEKNFSLAKFRESLAKMVSCKMSIKANTYITVEAMEQLIDDLRKCQNPYNCPHGRPTIISFTIYELEKMFKRSL